MAFYRPFGATITTAVLKDAETRIYDILVNGAVDPTMQCTIGDSTPDIADAALRNCKDGKYVICKDTTTGQTWEGCKYLFEMNPADSAYSADVPETPVTMPVATPSSAVVAAPLDSKLATPSAMPAATTFTPSPCAGLTGADYTACVGGGAAAPAAPAAPAAIPAGTPVVPPTPSGPSDAMIALVVAVAALGGYLLTRSR